MYRPFISRRTAILVGTTIASLSLVNSGVAQTGYGSSMDSGSHGHQAMPYGPSSGYGGYHASTAAEGFLRGKAAVIDAVGNFEVNDAQAQILREHARALDRENKLKQTEALQLQKKMWNDARIQARKDRLIRAAQGQQLLAER